MNLDNAMSGKISFQGRTEQLDWKKIASIDIDNLIQGGDTTQLMELIKPVTFCRADAEFDGGRLKIDPAFIKVFRISQLICEFLVASQEKSRERLANLEEKYNETEKEKEKLSSEILHLKETLTSAKKELKKRKEMLATTQNEILGENNSDEYDQCPYCSKKFLGPSYLLAHIQRRHQGLPIPANPLYPSSLPTGSTSLVCHHSHPQTPQTCHNRHPHQQTPGSGMYDPHISLPPQPSQHVQTLMSHQIFPAVHTPPPSVLYGNNQLLHQSNPSFSGSVTSLNNMPLNQHLHPGTGAISLTFGKRESFTQTSTQPNVDDSHPTATDDDGGGDAGMANTSTLGNWERVEVTKEEDVFRVPNQNPCSLEEENARHSEIDEVTKNAMISTSVAEGSSTRFPINSSQSHLREDGEVTKAPADVINHPQSSGGENQVKDFAELKRLLQVTLQEEQKSLISRLESQEKFWQDKLASLEQDHERQIQQLRQELLLIQNGTRQNNDGLLWDENGAVSANDKLRVEREIGDGEKEKNVTTCIDASSSDAPKSGVIFIVEPKRSHPTQQQITRNLLGAIVDPAQEDHDATTIESKSVPVAKPRTSRVGPGGQHPSQRGSPEQRQQHNKYFQQPERSHGGGTMEELKSLSESDPEFLTVIQPEEFHEGKHDYSIVPNSTDASATTTTTVPTTKVAATNNKESQQRNQLHAMSTLPPAPEKSGLVAGMNKSDNGRLEEEMAVTLETTEVNSDEVSDYTLSDSVDGDDERNNDICAASSHKNDRQLQQQHHHRHHHVEFSDHPKGKSSFKSAPVKKKYIFDAETRKILEVSPDDDDDEDGNEHSDNTDDLNNTSSADDDLTGGKRKKSQLDLVRAKTIMELEQNMSDIGLNPESRAIGMEEMKRALKHLKSQQRATPTDQNDYERLEEARKAVKTHAKFEATKSSIDEKLDAISSLSSKKPQQNSLVKIFCAVKSSGKNFGKRVASAVKKKHKSEYGSADEEEKARIEKRKRKSASAPAMKTTFFSKARWTRKKKGEGKKDEAATAGGKKAGEKETENSSDMSSSESEEEIELPAFMQRSSRGRARSSSRSSERRTSSGPSRHNSVRSKRSTSRPKSAKPLKRLNSNAGAVKRGSPSQKPKSSSSAFIVPSAGKRHSSESSPFSNVDDYDDNGELSSTYENRNVIVGDESKEQSGNRPSNKTQGRNKLHKRYKESKNGKSFQNSEEDSSEEENDDVCTDDVPREKETSLKRAGMQKSQTRGGDEGERRAEDDGSRSSVTTSSSSNSSGGEKSQSDEDWDDEVSFATSNEILVNAKSSGVVSSVGRNNKEKFEEEEEEDNNDHIDVIGKSRVSSGNPNSVTRGNKNWSSGMSDIRLKEIKQYVSKSKKEVTGDETSYTEEDSDEGFSVHQDRRREKDGKHLQYSENKHDYLHESFPRKMAFMETNTTENSHAIENIQQRRPSSSPDFQEGKQLEAISSTRFIPSGQTNTKSYSGHSTTINSFTSGLQAVPQSSFSQAPNFMPTSSTATPATGSLLTSTFLDTRENVRMGKGQREIPVRQQRNSFDDMNDLDDLLNTASSDEDKTEERVETKSSTGGETKDGKSKRALDISTFRGKPASSAIVIQPTNHHHHHITGLGMANLRNKAEAQQRILHNSGRGSPASRNSWDSMK